MEGASILSWEELDSSVSSTFHFPLKLNCKVMASLKKRRNLRSAIRGGILKKGEGAIGKKKKKR